MSNSTNSSAIKLPPRVIRRTLQDVIDITARHNGDEERLRQNATGTSAAEWIEDMGWLYEQRETVPLTERQFSVLRERLRERHREIWGIYAYTPD